MTAWNSLKVIRSGIMAALTLAIVGAAPGSAWSTLEADRVLAASVAPESPAARPIARDIINLEGPADGGFVLDVRDSEIGERFLKSLRTEIKRWPNLALEEQAMLIYRISFTPEYMSEKDQRELARDRSFLRRFFALARPPLPGVHIDDIAGGAVVQANDAAARAAVEGLLHRSYSEVSMRATRLAPNSWRVVSRDPDDQPGVIVEDPNQSAARRLLLPLQTGEALRLELRDPVYLDIEPVGDGEEAWAPVTARRSVFGERLGKALEGNKDLRLSAGSGERVTIRPADGARLSPTLSEFESRLRDLIKAAGERP